jgi:hypothetical protein
VRFRSTESLASSIANSSSEPPFFGASVVTRLVRVGQFFSRPIDRLCDRIIHPVRTIKRAFDASTNSASMQKMFEVEMQLLQTLQVEDLTTSRKLSFAEFCALCNINVLENRFRLLRNILSCFRVIMDEHVLRMCGFTGSTFLELSKQLRRFLTKHRSIETHVFSTDQFRTVYTIDWINLEALLVLVKNDKAVSARAFIHLMRVALERYKDYELTYERSRVQSLLKENHDLSGDRDTQRKELHKVFVELHTLQRWVCDINRQYNWSIKSSEMEKNRAVEMERRFAQRERERADIERQRALEEQQKRELIEERLEKLQWEIGGKLSQTESAMDEVERYDTSDSREGSLRPEAQRGTLRARTNSVGNAGNTATNTAPRVSLASSTHRARRPAQRALSTAPPLSRSDHHSTDRTERREDISDKLDAAARDFNTHETRFRRNRLERQDRVCDESIITTTIESAPSSGAVGLSNEATCTLGNANPTSVGVNTIDSDHHQIATTAINEVEADKVETDNTTKGKINTIASDDGNNETIAKNNLIGTEKTIALLRELLGDSNAMRQGEAQTGNVGTCTARNEDQTDNRSLDCLPDRLVDHLSNRSTNCSLNGSPNCSPNCSLNRSLKDSQSVNQSTNTTPGGSSGTDSFDFEHETSSGTNTPHTLDRISCGHDSNNTAGGRIVFSFEESVASIVVREYRRVTLVRVR